jgi:ribosome maturation protein Sdo1
LINRQGTQGIYDHASNAELDSEFGTHKIEEVAEIILQDGSIIQNKVSIDFPEQEAKLVNIA